MTEPTEHPEPLGDFDPRDVALQAHTPTVIAPRYGNALEPLQENGHRYIVATDGLWIEIQRPWIHAVRRIASTLMPLPYGEEWETIEHWLDDADLQTILAQFAEYAYRMGRNECAAIGVYSEDTQTTTLRLMATESVGPTHVKYVRPVLTEGEHVAVDLHSHGHGVPFFSDQDDRDDAGEVKLSIVLGNTHEYPNYAIAEYLRLFTSARWCLQGHFEYAQYMVSP